MKPRRYIPDLQESAAVCEGNYLRLMKLLPELEAGEQHVFLVQQSSGIPSRVVIQVREVHKYTTMLSLLQQGSGPRWLTSVCMQVRLYHDANMAEVTQYQGERNFDGRYQYPNPGMRQPDEKVQLNRFLADWLNHCLQYGQTRLSFGFAID